MIKKILMFGFILLLIATVGLLVGVRMFVTGAGGLDEWVMRQVVGVAQTYLVPTIEFDEFSYIAPRTVTYRGVRLLAPDGTQVVDAGELIVTLSKIPKRGEPIVIEGVTIRDGSLHLIADPNDPETMFKGLAPFVKQRNIKEQEKLPKEVRISETLELRTVTLDNASIVYDSADGQPPMRFDDLTLTMNIDSSESGGEVWHRLDFKIDRGDLFQLFVNGRVNLDQLAAEFEALKFRIDVGSESIASLPSQVQTILKEYDAQGIIELNLNGAVALREWQQSEINGEILIEGFNIAMGEFRLPIREGELPLHMGEGEAVIGPGHLTLLDGVFQPTARIDLENESFPMVAQWKLSGLDLRELLRLATPDGEQPKYAGRLRTFGSASMELTKLPDSIDGQGELHVTDGRLGNIPGLKGLVALIDTVNPTRNTETYTDRLDAVFQLTDHAVLIESAELETRTILARGKGKVHYNTTLDMRINAGPFKKAESLLRGVGKLIGRISDQLVDYHLTGTVGNPKIAIRPFGF